MVLTDSRVDAEFELNAPEHGYDVVIYPEVVEGQRIYVARHPELARCFAQGATPDEAAAALDEVREEYLADMRAAGIDVPPAKLYPRHEVLASEPVPESPPSSSGQPVVSWRVVRGDARILTVTVKQPS